MTRTPSKSRSAGATTCAPAGEEYRPVLHAKCVIVDDERALVTSANFAESALERNVEAGTLVDDPRLARALRDQFDGLITAGALRPVPGLGG